MTVSTSLQPPPLHKTTLQTACVLTYLHHTNTKSIRINNIHIMSYIYIYRLLTNQHVHVQVQVHYILYGFLIKSVSIPGHPGKIRCLRPTPSVGHLGIAHHVHDERVGDLCHEPLLVVDVIYLTVFSEENKWESIRSIRKVSRIRAPWMDIYIDLS